MPEDHRMTITSSPHLAPDDVARHTFASVRRGFDPNEVRDYLESIAAGLRGIAERERQILQDLAEAEHRAEHPVLDEPTLTAALGQETARVLHSAHEVAAEMLANAEAEANRLVTEATEAADRSRTSTEARMAERAAEADAAIEELRGRTSQQVATAIDAARVEADGLLSQAREECRAMVDEAQQLRARVLADLARRRKVLHAQIEQLRAGRERLAETIQDVRRSVDVIADDLFTAEDDARLAAEAAGREVLSRHDETTPEEMAAALLADEAEAAAELDRSGEPAVEGDAGPAPVEDSRSTTAEATGGPAATTPPSESVDALFAKLRAAHEEPESDDHAPGSGGGAAGKAGAESEAAEAEAGEGEGGDASADGPPEERNPAVIRRDELVEPIVISLGRRLKRTLQDSQNDLLDRLRSTGFQWTIDLLSDETEHLDAYATASLPALEEAAEAGFSFAGTGATRGPDTDALVRIAHDLAEAVVGPLRRRLSDDDGLADAEESVLVEHVGSAFREWKGERIERLAGDHVVAAFSAGSIAAAEGSSAGELEWVAVAGSGDAPCPDCEDNGLTGSQRPGEAFPTGHAHPPAHPGCRCLLMASAT